MDAIAFIIGETFLYWHAIILALGAVTGICFLLCFYLKRSDNGVAAVLIVPMCCALGIILARVIHWYGRMDSYDSLFAALTNLSRGGFALMGVFLGVPFRHVC